MLRRLRSKLGNPKVDEGELDNINGLGGEGEGEVEDEDEEEDRKDEERLDP